MIFADGAEAVVLLHLSFFLKLEGTNMKKRWIIPVVVVLVLLIAGGLIWAQISRNTSSPEQVRESKPFAVADEDLTDSTMRDEDKGKDVEVAKETPKAIVEEKIEAETDGGLDADGLIVADPEQTPEVLTISGRQSQNSGQSGQSGNQQTSNTKAPTEPTSPASQKDSNSSNRKNSEQESTNVPTPTNTPDSNSTTKPTATPIASERPVNNDTTNHADENEQTDTSEAEHDEETTPTPEPVATAGAAVEFGDLNF